MQRFAEKLKTGVYFFNNPASICWMLNIRGEDIDYNLIFLCYGIFYKKTNKLQIFCDDIEKLKINYKNIEVLPLSMLDEVLEKISEPIAANNVSIYYQNLLNEKLQIETDHCDKLRSIKNNIEIEHSKNIHIQDAVALINFWHWLKSSNEDKNELIVCRKLLEFRKKQKDFFCESFETIAGFNENSAIIHYNPTIETNQNIVGDGLLLLDSGGHYFGGTTDVTRVFAINHVTEEQRLHYTLVLKSHLKLLRSIFPYNLPMHQLNTISRYNLWQEKLDFNHGVGHGVSNFLEVHESPYSINSQNNELLVENLILSNEPGLYFDNKYGIRIENLMHSKLIDSKYIQFENLTMVPYETRLINKKMLDQGEIDQINKYHEEIYGKLSKFLDITTLNWLKMKKIL